MKKNNFKLSNSYANKYVFINRLSNEKINENINKNSANRKKDNAILSYTASLSLFIAMVASTIYVGDLSLKNQNKNLDEEISTSEIKEANILEIDDNINKFMKLDINGNGKFDNGDNFIPGMYRFELTDEGESVVFLENIAGTKPLAYSTKNKEYILIKNPSEYYIRNSMKTDELNKKINNLDEEFKNFMKNKEIVKSR